MKPSIAMIASSVADIIINIEKLPHTQQDCNIQNQQISLGGCGYNVAHAVSLFDVPYLLCTSIGTGIYGEFVSKMLHEEAVPLLFPRHEQENGCCYCFVEASGERTFVAHRGAEYHFKEQWFVHLDQLPIDTVYLCGLDLEEEDTRRYVFSYLSRHPHITVYFAPGPRLSHLPAQVFQELCSYHCILHLSEIEALSLSGASSVDEAAIALYSMTKQAVIITLGEQGSLCYEQGFIRSEAIPTKVINTIGAGDAHIGSIIACRSLGYDWKTALTKANEVSSQVVGVQGSTLPKDQFHR